MPATSISALNSWGIYMVAAFVLLLVLSPQLPSVSSDSGEGVDMRNLGGVSQVLSELRPGVSVRFAFGAPGSGPILIGGHQLTCSYGAGAIRDQTATNLPNETLYPSVSYLAYLSGGEVEVVQAG